MGAAVRYACTALYGVNKTGKLVCDAEGYYDVTLGALDYYNNTGAFYALAPARKLFEDSSILMRRIKKGVLNGEYQHPEKLPGMSDKEYLMRVLRIDEKMVSHHVKEVYIDETTVKDKNGCPVVIVRGRIKPKGPYGDVLAKSLENPNENVYFSVRSLTDDFLDTATGDIIKNTLEIITWDHVNEGGIDIACKFDTPSLECLTETRFTKDVIMLAKNAALAADGTGMEDDRKSSIIQLADYVEAKNPTIRGSRLIVPAWARW